ncbi:enhanced intracellular survival protein Eis [Saccharibacillus sp. JS10]|uniref:GNAT family N-acetyltransferase n=1 Tax=Saccharibacillus sp. JS10 TaxID=2950552 RepID=UPI00210B9276|nr:GNAT family N-acetyltransferase [Saccharibacillus sp. JS10]MCQ4086308.1 GNAT family N-acetyltransferase [Saccharibacillus sp. JS10]
MEIRRLNQQDFDAYIALDEYAFLYKVSEKDKEEDRRNFDKEKVIGAFENEELSAKLVLLPFEVYIHGQVMQMGGIGGVATWPEKRRQGMVSQLLRQGLEEMKGQGQLISYLYPFSVGFYRKYGWELFTDNKKYQIPVEKLPPLKNVPGRVVREVRDIEVLKSIYDRAIVRFNGAVVRSEEWWTKRVLKRATYTAVYYNEAKEPEAYVMYKIENEKWMTKEMFWINETARQGIWDFIVNHDSRITEVQMNTPVDDPFYLLLPDPIVKQEIQPNCMARVVDVVPFVEQYPFVQTGTEHAFTVHIQDPHAPWNDGLWNWQISREGIGRLEKLESGEHGLSEATDVTLSIGTLTAILLGYRRPAELQQIGLLETSEDTAQLLNQVIPVRTPFIVDFF